MRNNRKVTALLLTAALIVCGCGTGICAGKTQAASRTDGYGTVFKTASDGAVDTGNPDQTTSPGAVQPTISPLPNNTVTPAAVTSGASYKVGDKFTSGNYQYKVVTVPEGSKAGSVKLTSLAEKAQSKTSLAVPASITKDGDKFAVTGIGTKAFTTSTAVKTVIIRQNVTFIGNRAFQKVKTLQSVTIGENVTQIKNRAFAGCVALRTVTIPSNVKQIRARSFYNCKKLKSVVIESKKITTVNTAAFNKNKSSRYFVVPSGKKSLYKSLLTSSGASVKIYTF